MHECVSLCVPRGALHDLLGESGCQPVMLEESDPRCAAKEQLDLGQPGTSADGGASRKGSTQETPNNEPPEPRAEERTMRMAVVVPTNTFICGPQQQQRMCVALRRACGDTTL